MKNILKLSILFPLLVVIFLSGCVNKEEKIKEDINNALNSIAISEVISEDILLPTNVLGYKVTWDSSNVDVISKDGKVVQGPSDVIVNLRATIKVDGIELFKTFNVLVKKIDPVTLVDEVLDSISIPTEVSSNIDLPNLINGLAINWSTSDKQIITNQGIVTQYEENMEVTLKASVSYSGIYKNKSFVVTVLANPTYKLINEALKNINIPSETYDNIVLPNEVSGINITWKSTSSNVLSNTGVVNRTSVDKIVTLTATCKYEDVTYDKYYDVTVKGWTDIEKIRIVVDNISFSDKITSDLVLNKELGYGCKAEWTSSNQDVLTNDGKYTYNENVKTITLKVVVSLGSEDMTKEFILNVALKEEAKKEHLVIKRAETYDSSKFTNVMLKDGKLVLSSGAKVGTYESEVIETKEFTSLVASWAAISSTTATVEIEVKVRVGSVWSDYISYKQWGLGLNNACYDQSNSLIKLATDEVKVLNSKRGSALQFRVTLRTTEESTPELSLVCFALEIPGHVHNVDISNYPKSIVHTVPRLYQIDVPVIGDSICSATSSTMLLKYKGEDFTSFDSEYEHRYIAGIVRDYGNKIYGNWVYNTVAMSAYGYDSYVARFYSINELIEQLATVGPCALSVKGQMTSDKKNYYTKGHLIVAIGYEIGENGNITIVCNDPNVPSVECRYSLTVINNTWRNIAYIIE